LGDVLLSVTDLKKHFPLRSAVLQRVIGEKTVLDGITCELDRGETLGIVGESESGKSTLLRVLLGVVEASNGEMLLDGQPLQRRIKDRPNSIKRRIQMVFQDPTKALHPRMTVFRSLAETFRVFGTESGKSVEQEIAQLLHLVGLSPHLARRYPHQLSGGQRQRVVVARALAGKPDILLCDDPITALDVSLSAQVLNLFLDLQEQFGLSYIFVTNDLAVLRQLAHRIAILREGRFVELSEAKRIYSHPEDAYTRELLEAAPSIQRGLQTARST
jgi:ABC-type glutathione transport system ATPase component